MPAFVLALLPALAGPVLTELVKVLAPRLGAGALKVISTVLGLLSTAVTAAGTGVVVTPEMAATAGTAALAGPTVYDAGKAVVTKVYQGGNE